jgi:hypothetical protein
MIEFAHADLIVGTFHPSAILEFSYILFTFLIQIVPGFNFPVTFSSILLQLLVLLGTVNGPSVQKIQKYDYRQPYKPSSKNSRVKQFGILLRI